MVKLYVEGAGPSNSAATECRRAFHDFFEAAGLKGKRPRTVACGSRKDAYDAFANACRSNDGNLPLLLVDSETAVAAGTTVWQHLKNGVDNWDKPAHASDEQAFLMVQTTETWLLADVATLKAYFGQQFRESHIKAWPSLEDVPKDVVFQALDCATSSCAKKYAKGKICFELLGKLDPQKVQNASPHAKRLLDRLRAV